MFKLFFGMRSEGLARLPARGPYIIAPNHVSMLDWAFVSYFLGTLTRFVAHREYFEQPILGFGLRVNGAIAVNGGRPEPTTMRILQSILRSGEPLILFPEGAISRNGRPGRGQPGIIHLAATTEVPIVPVAIRGAHEAFPRHRTVPRPGRVRVIFGEPLPPPPATDRPGQQDCVARLMGHIAQLLDGHRHAGRPW
jgi:1-acyl-sn-glycerol-3-phosphate acyltransferase